MLWALVVIACWSSRLLAQVVTPPTMLGPIAGPGAVVEPRLPIHRNAAGALQLRPRYFAGVLWNVSVWNPYLVALLKTSVKPSVAAVATACSSGAAARDEGPPAHLRWCARK